MFVVFIIIIIVFKTFLSNCGKTSKMADILGSISKSRIKTDVIKLRLLLTKILTEFRFSEHLGKVRLQHFLLEYYLHLIMLIERKPRNATVIRSKTEVSSKLINRLFNAVPIDEFRGRGKLRIVRCLKVVLSA